MHWSFGRSGFVESRRGLNQTLRNKITKIHLLALDVDGVLTDGKIIFDSTGKETKIFDVQDGFALIIFKRAGFKTAIITARDSKVVHLRAKDLNIDKTYVDAFPKLLAYEKLLKHFRLKDEQVCFVGDDLPDVQVLKRAGFAVAVKNACREVKNVADYVTKAQGGAGAIREVVELILEMRGQWRKIIVQYT